MEKAESILIVENECEIIKPKVINRQNNNKINCDFNEIIKRFNSSNIESKNKSPIFEILSILNKPIYPIYKKRNFLKRKNMHLNNKECENIFKNSIDFNKKEDLNNSEFFNISKVFGINTNLSFKEKI